MTGVGLDGILQRPALREQVVNRHCARRTAAGDAILGKGRHLAFDEVVNPREAAQSLNNDSDLLNCYGTTAFLDSLHRKNNFRGNRRYGDPAMFMTLRSITAIIAGCTLLLSAIPAYAQSWPLRTVRLVIPFGAGGTADITARTIAQKLSEKWGQQVVVENKPGGDTVIAAAEVQRAAPDGYTLLLAINSTLTLTPHTMKVTYDPVNDFVIIGQTTVVPMLVLVNESTPAQSISELISLARTKPGELNAGGPATVTHLLLEQFAREAKIKFTWVPYKSGPDTTKALLGGEIQVGVDGVINNLPFIQSGKLKALAVSTSTRLKTLPQVPTLLEQGIRDQRISLSHVMLAPRGLPKLIVDKLKSDLQAVLGSADVNEKLTNVGIQAAWIDGDNLAKSFPAESEVTGALVRELGLKP